MEAQACYSLGNTYTLLKDYERAIDYHLKHLVIAQDLNDRYWPKEAILCQLSAKLSLKYNEHVQFGSGWP